MNIFIGYDGVHQGSLDSVRKMYATFITRESGDAIRGSHGNAYGIDLSATSVDRHFLVTRRHNVGRYSISDILLSLEINR